MSENQEQTRLQKMGENLHIAEQQLDGLAEYLLSARREFEASVNGDDRNPYEPQMKIDIEQALTQLATCSIWLKQAFEMPAVQEILRAYRCDGEELSTVPETQISADVR